MNVMDAQNPVDTPPTRQGPPPALIFFGAVLSMVIGLLTIGAAWRFSNSARVKVENVPQNHLAVPDDSSQALLKEFTLTERSGREFSSDELSGKVWVASFFWASCPGSCRKQNETIKSLHSEMRGGDELVFVSITCDPQADSPNRLAEYAKLFDAHPRQWLFLTGDLLYTRRVGAEFFQLFVGEKQHMDYFAVVDKWGKVRGRYEWSNSQQLNKLRAQIRELREELEAPAAAQAESQQQRPPAGGEDDGGDEGDDDDGRGTPVQGVIIPKGSNDSSERTSPSPAPTEPGN
ncbi:MAG: SCO family protein [Pirellulaceae bacterium]|nr:SCO family protein [Pirellulaceae bacterium]